MNVYTVASALIDSPKPVSIAAGFFDGVHIGHRLVLNAAIADAATRDAEAWVLTFDKHPLAVVAPSRRPPLLFTLEQRLAAFESLGISNVLLQPFTRELAVMEPEAYVAYLSGTAIPRRDNRIFCGENWRFGRQAQGSAALIQAIGAPYGLSAHIVPYAFYQGERVSSSRIRETLQAGDLADVQAMLSAPYAFSGTVIHGKHLATTLFGAPTANLDSTMEVLPPNGVYRVNATLPDGTTHPAIANIGQCPTIGELPKPLVEVHIPNWTGDLYGATLHVALLSMIRREQKFDAIDALKAQVQKDIDSLTAY